MRRLFSWLAELAARRSKKPWARFTVSGIGDDGQVKFDMAWNKAFVKNIAQYGFEGESEEVSVQHFLFGSLMLPKEVFDDQDTIVSEAHPHLQSERHHFVR